MRKQTKQLIVLAVLCIFLLVLFFVLRSVGKEETGEESTAITLKTTDKEEITAFSYLLNGESYSYTKEGDTWVYDGDRSLKLDQSRIEEMLDTVTAVEADNSLGNVKDLEEYGLAEPFETITVQTKQGSFKLYIGDYNTMVSAYYFMMDGSDVVYARSGGFCEAFQDKPQDMIAEEESVSENGTANEER